MDSRVELIADYACHTGENPLWHPREQKLYWTDIESGRLFRYDPHSGFHEQIYLGRPVGGFTFEEDGGLLLFMDRGTIAHWRDGVLKERLAEIPAERNSRFNDVIATSSGTVFCGTMSSAQEKGRLYRLDTDGTLRVVLDGIGISNGMAFSRDQKTFFYTDSLAGEIYGFDYHKIICAITNQRVFARFDKAEGLPDGCTIDSEDHLWSALWDGGCVVCHGLDGSVLRKLCVPARQTSSLVFGGSDLSHLYVTTAGGHEKHVNGRYAGALFRLDAGCTGIPEAFSRMTAPQIRLVY